MKRILMMLLCLFILSSCEKVSILNTIYISSVGIDYVEGSYVGYFYSPPAKDLSKESNSDDDATVFVVKEEEFVDIFVNMYDSDPINVNMFHLKTMILSDSFKEIDLLLDFFKYCDNISYNFHVFVTNDDLSEIYKYKSMSNISNLYNFLNSPSLIDYEEHGVSKCHFLNFANDYYNEYRYLSIPLVKIENNSLDGEFQLRIDGYSNLEYIYESSIYKGICFFYNVDKEISYNNEVVKLQNYKINFKCINDVYTFDIFFYKVNIYGNLDIKEYIINEIDYYIETVINQEGSINYINQYNYLYKKNIDNTKYLINITIK